MEITVGQLAKLVGGQVDGNADTVVSTFAPIDEAMPGALTFLSNPKYNHFLYTTQASAVLVGNDFTPEKEYSPCLIRVADVYSTVSALLEKFNANSVTKTGREEPCFVAASAKLGTDVYVGAFAYIGEKASIGNNVKIFPQAYIGDGVEIGDNTIIYAGARLYSNTRIGKNCILHAGCVLGSDGFGFAPQPDGSYKKVPQTGNVVIDDNVEIGANTTIDRATMKSTHIHTGVKLDNLIQVAHNVEIGENTAIAAQAGISGSTHIGKRNVIGGQVGVVGHITTADGTQIGAQSGISKSITEPDRKWFGSPADEYKQAIKAQVIFKKLPELYAEIRELKAELKKLKDEKKSD
jgi:UDP-3-O-[3-hydroxymyristoyl] glucosamine N-acyltransferase